MLVIYYDFHTLISDELVSPKLRYYFVLYLIVAVKLKGKDAIKTCFIISEYYSLKTYRVIFPEPIRHHKVPNFQLIQYLLLLIKYSSKWAMCISEE